MEGAALDDKGVTKAFKEEESDIPDALAIAQVAVFATVFHHSGLQPRE